MRVLATDPDPDGAADIADTVVLLPPGRAQLVRQLGESAPAGTLVSDGRRPELLRSAAPRLALLLSAKPVPPALATLRLGPDAHLAVAGTRRTSLPSPLFDRVWLVKRTDAPGALQAAFAAGPDPRPAPRTRPGDAERAVKVAVLLPPRPRLRRTARPSLARAVAAATGRRDRPCWRSGWARPRRRCASAAAGLGLSQLAGGRRSGAGPGGAATERSGAGRPAAPGSRCRCC